MFIRLYMEVFSLFFFSVSVVFPQIPASFSLISNTCSSSITCTTTCIRLVVFKIKSSESVPVGQIRFWERTIT